MRIQPRNPRRKTVLGFANEFDRLEAKSNFPEWAQFYMPIYEFRREHHFLSNFFKTPCTIEKTILHPHLQQRLTHEPAHITFLTSEHAYQAAKAMHPKDFYKVMRAASAGQAKKSGGKIEIRPDWERVRNNVMTHCIRGKFSTIDVYKASGTTRWCREALLKTTSRPLIEGNTWHDNYWGDCHCGNADGKHPECLQPGENMLGKTIMEFRTMIRSGYI